jgi:hypothetical protein
MIIWFLTLVLTEMNEKGYLYSVGKEQFLSFEGDQVRTIEKNKMPNMFEIETRGGDYSYYLRIYPSPRRGDKVMDKDWWYNDHKLIFYPINDWMSQHFVFSLLPKNQLKIMVKERCAEVKDDGTIKASLCKSKSDNKFQYFRWIREDDKRVVRAFVRKHSRRMRQSKYDNDENLGYRNRGGYGGGYGGGSGYGGSYDRDYDDYDDYDDIYGQNYGRGRGRGRNRGRGGIFGSSSYGRGEGCGDDIDCDEEAEKYGKFGYRGDDDFFVRKPRRRGGSYKDEDCDEDDDMLELDNEFRSNRNGRRRGPYRKRRKSDLAQAMCSDDIDEIGKIICEINKMPNLVM